jgi:hypothetical protein
VVQLAKEEAGRRLRECIRTEDILVALVREGNSLAAYAIDFFGLDLAQITRETEVHPGNARFSIARVQFSGIRCVRG